MTMLESPFYQFSLSPESATWSLLSAHDGDNRLESVRMHAAYTQGGLPYRLLEHWTGIDLTSPETAPSQHGLLRQLHIFFPPDEQGLRASIVFALALEQPFFLWKLHLYNLGSRPLQIERLTLLSANLSAARQAKIQNLRFFSNGWGSWNYTGSYGPLDRYRRTRLGFLSRPMRVNAGTPQPQLPGHFASDQFGVLGNIATRRGLLLGFLSQLQHFGSLETMLLLPKPLLRLWANGDSTRLEPGAAMTTDWACISHLDLDTCDPLGPYLQAAWRESVAEQPLAINEQRLAYRGQRSTPTTPLIIDCDPNPDHLAHLSGQTLPIPTSWCSWYQYYQDVTAQNIRRNMDFLNAHRSQLPVELIQIDDGFETLAGDWYTFRPGFPGGPALLAQEICSAGKIPGLWLAPFIVDRRSKLAKTRPEWLLRGRFNLPANAGFVWNNLTTALDLTIPAALDYARQLIETAAHDWGFPYLKLDFLYAAALPGGYHDPTRTRAQVLRAGLEAIREAAGPQTFLLGCGCPLGPAIGLFEAMRIGADVAPNWSPRFMGWGMYFHKEPDYPSARNAIQNALTRIPMHRRWWLNDPDCLLVRPTLLSLPEVQTLASVILLSGGLLLLSDNLPKLPPERLRLLHQLFPPIGQTPRVLDWIESNTPARLRLDLDGPGGAWHLLARFNWDDQPQSLELSASEFQLDPQTHWVAREFWSQEIYSLKPSAVESSHTCQVSLPAHGVALLAVRQTTAEAQYLGSDLHISQGQELAAWQPGPHGLRLHLERPGQVEGIIDLNLPHPPRVVRIGERQLAWTELGAGRYRVSVRFEESAAVEVEYE